MAPRLTVVALLAAALWVFPGCCRLTGNFGGGPCPSSSPSRSDGRGGDAQMRAADVRHDYTIRLQYTCGEAREVAAVSGSGATYGDETTERVLPSPKDVHLRAPGAKDECWTVVESNDPHLSVWTRRPGEAAWDAHRVDLVEKPRLRNVVVVSCAGDEVTVTVSHPPFPGAPCD